MEVPCSPRNFSLPLPFPRRHIAANTWTARGWRLEIGSSQMLKQPLPVKTPGYTSAN